MAAKFQLNPGGGRSRSGDEASTDALVERLTRRGAGLPKRERAAIASAKCVDVFTARRSLWMALMAHAPLRLAEVLRARAAEGEDYSNRQGIAELRVALAEWLEGWDAAQAKKEKRAARRGKVHRRQLPLWGPETWPTLTPQNEKSLRGAWPHVDLIADRDAKCLQAAAELVADECSQAGAAVRSFRRAVDLAAEWNGRLAIATAHKFFAGDSVSLSMNDLIMVSMDGLYRGLMDYDPTRGRPSTHLVHWCRQRVSKELENGTMIHVPAWVRQTMSAVRRGSDGWRNADTARRKAEAKARRAGASEAEQKAAGAAAWKKAASAGMVPPLDPSAVVAAADEIAAGIGEARAVELLESLGLDAWAAEARAAAVSEASLRDAGEAVTLALGHVAAGHERRLESLLDALRVAPSHIDSIDDDGDEERARPGIVLAADGGDGVGEAQTWVQSLEVRDLLARLAERDEAGAEEAEIIRRSFGLEVGEFHDRPHVEALTAIARTGLYCTGRKVHRNQAAKMRDAGIAWVREKLGEPEPVVTLWTCRARGAYEPDGCRLARALGRLRRERRRQEREASPAQGAVVELPKRRRKLPPPRVHQRAKLGPVLAQA